MYKRKDNDIFGTNQIGYSPRIENNNYVDPNAAFKRKAEQNYEKYASQVNNVPRVITAKSRDTSAVNEKANFQDNYHKNRKELDMKSFIFYPPSRLPQREISSPQVNQSKNNNSNKEQNHGRRQTLNRQVNSLSYNNSEIKGNSSRLFDLDLRINEKADKSTPIVPLIPYQMQWDQHDSVRYNQINSPKQTVKTIHKASHQSLNSIQESKSTYIHKDPINTINNQEEKAKQKKILKAKSDSKIPTAKNTTNTKNKQPVQIKILKGWDFKLMEGLSKQCKYNNVAILKFEVQEKGQASITLKRSERWQLVTDWLRKDAKLKIRVLNN